jgi:multimeric flavodoxin WrbA
MKVLGIVAGPRKTGHTAKLVEEVLKGAEEAGHEAKVIYLSEMNITPLTWEEDAYCYPEDDFTKIMPEIESMGALVFGSPIYYDQVSSRAKLFIDRMYYYAKSRGGDYYEKVPKGVKFINAITCGWDNKDAYTEVVEWLNGRMTNYWEMEIVGGLKAHGSGNNPVKDNKKLLEEARELGKSL